MDAAGTGQKVTGRHRWWRPQFSLLTLLLVGSAGLVWAQEEAWRDEKIALANEQYAWAARFVGDDIYALTRDGTGTYRLWNITAGKELWAISAGDELLARPYKPGPECHVLLTRGAQSYTLTTWDAHTGKRLHTFQQKGVDNMEAALSSDGGRVLLTEDAVAHICDSRTGERLVSLKGHEKPIWIVAFSLDGRLAATGDPSGVVTLWDTQTGQRRYTLPAQKDGVLGMDFSPDGRLLATSDFDSVRRTWFLHTWDTASGALLNSIEDYRCWPSPFSPDGQRLVAVHSPTAFVLDRRTGRKLFEIPRDEQQIAVCPFGFSSDGRRLLALRIYSTESKRLPVLQVWTRTRD